MPRARSLWLQKGAERVGLRVAPKESLARAVARVRRERTALARRGFALRGNVALGPGASSPIVLSAAERRALARVPPSVVDRRELAAMLASPDDYSGGVAFVRGGKVVKGDLDAARYAALVVLGDFEVAGVLTQLEHEPVVIVTGNLTAQDLIVTGGVFVGGDIAVRGTAYFEGDHGAAHVGGSVQAASIVLDALELHVGRTVDGPVLAREVELLHPRARRRGANVSWPAPAGDDAFPHFREVETRMLLGLALR